jgi:hypothetical protein
VSGADPIAERPGFKAMLDRIAGNGVRCILVESPDRFARDLTVQLTGHDFLKSLGISLIPATAPDFFTEETPTAVLVRAQDPDGEGEMRWPRLVGRRDQRAQMHFSGAGIHPRSLNPED